MPKLLTLLTCDSASIVSFQFTCIGEGCPKWNGALTGTGLVLEIV